MATLNARLREGTGKSVTRKLRSRGEIPAVAYGHGQEGRALSVNAHELTLLLGSINRENTIIDLRIEGDKPVQALIREVQQHPSRPHLLHVDFFQVRAGETLHVNVPVVVHGSPIGVREQGGVLQEVLHELAVECLPKDIPQSIDLHVDDLGIGDAIHVSDVNVPNVTILNDGALVICSVTMPTVASLPEGPETEAGVGGDVGPELVRDHRGDAADVPSESGTAQRE
jgi:large subunit ribosomal protein L25